MKKITLLITVLMSLTLSAQITVKGRYIDGNKKPISGAKVWVEGKTISTTTDEKGNFSLKAERWDTVIFGEIGSFHIISDNASPLKFIFITDRDPNLSIAVTTDFFIDGEKVSKVDFINAEKEKHLFKYRETIAEDESSSEEKYNVQIEAYTKQLWREATQEMDKNHRREFKRINPIPWSNYVALTVTLLVISLVT
ncbi:CarboxypepD_reg-like domain-containing protein [Capnocytophaga haemolytica]|jgi:hypothetical protein|uniref:TonB-linked outer membrane protein, SusC/RagA family n=1 Tax=Capnocytophaga haemolytica TaxID=45243 RepID=A0AAX2H0B6_9FLAO|nr:carboxypeptidase-like regulatory domain-containing protein [Capnocytophaga haemolytica]AMD85883.1 hypothetical protein AXF12_10385 [Capnocytophaga haemolytica]SFO04033.1 CarboxypepD_reg-like domain-containing protein [Capnocytophaga haemolytica]SNV15441.1 TonB-linked outer membrane protein, SusC/RagA family [Capnocytophaga haemolytica]